MVDTLGMNLYLNYVHALQLHIIYIDLLDHYLDDQLLCRLDHQLLEVKGPTKHQLFCRVIKLTLIIVMSSQPN